MDAHLLGDSAAYVLCAAQGGQRHQMRPPLCRPRPARYKMSSDPCTEEKVGDTESTRKKKRMHWTDLYVDMQRSEKEGWGHIDSSLPFHNLRVAQEVTKVGGFRCAKWLPHI